ncbi:MAG: hypothetical protein IPO77_22670 [Acidobacteria bacterium]|nr:hypothetical protein [Acidobacteriota bacterium]
MKKFSPALVRSLLLLLLLYRLSHPKPLQPLTTYDFQIANGAATIHRRVCGNEVVAVQIYLLAAAPEIPMKETPA